MTTTPAADHRAPDVAGRSFGELMGEVADDLSTLVRQEIALAKAEVRQEAAKAGKASGMLAGAGVAGHMVLLFLSIALWWGLSNVMDGGWSALIVAAIWAAVGAVLYSRGRAQMRYMRGMPRTTETLAEIPGALKPHQGATR